MNDRGTVAQRFMSPKCVAVALVTGVAAAIGAVLLFSPVSNTRSNIGRTVTRTQRCIPKVLRLEDFQMPLDREMLSHLNRVGELPGGDLVGDFINDAVLKPFIDAVTTATLNVSAVEVTPRQLPECAALYGIVEECARILHLEKTPKLFIVNDATMNAYTTNCEQPVIVLNSGLIQTYSTGDELRFVIGHEMGHIACRHVKWMMVLRLLIGAYPSDGLLSTVRAASVLSLLKWARDAEMSADNAALLCVQNLDTCEQSLARLALGLPRQTVGRIDIDAFIEQGEDRESSGFADTILLIQSLASTHPWPCARIRHLREYHASETYRCIVSDEE